MLQARCRSLAPSEFFPSDGVGVERARKICDQCGVKVECLEYALTYRIDHGVWGGASERERRRILRRRRLGANVTEPLGPRFAARRDTRLADAQLQPNGPSTKSATFSIALRSGVNRVSRPSIASRGLSLTTVNTMPSRSHTSTSALAVM
jgi:WhiB family transcriptional regulator, redox-sensing transcriptional regulator